MDPQGLDEHDDNHLCDLAPSLEKATKATSGPAAAKRKVLPL